MDAKNRQFLDLVNGSKQFVVPVFQRDYSWTQEQCLRFWKDVLQAGRPNAAGGHFLGSIVYVGVGPTGAAFNTLQVIDGQQRLTTLVLLLTALRDHITDVDWTGTDDSPTPLEIDQVFLKNPKKGHRAHKLRLRRADNDSLRSLIDAEPTANASKSSLIADAYASFRAKLKHSDPDVVYSGLGRFVVVDVALDRTIDNPQLIFESLNSTGVALSQSDLVRNYLLMGLDEDQQTRLYERHWTKLEDDFRHVGSTPDRFLREYVGLKSGSRKAIRDHEIYDEFKRYWKPPEEQPDKHVESLETLLKDLVKFGDYFLAVVAPRKFPERRSHRLAEALVAVQAFGVAHTLLAMQLFECHEDGHLTESDFIEALRVVESYIVRRTVLGWSSRDYWPVFANVARNLMTDDAETGTLEDLRVAFAQQAQRFPTDDEFDRAIQDTGLYHRRDRGKAILSRLENFGQREPSPVDEYSVEHIMPQSMTGEWRAMVGEQWQRVHEEWLHRLGNLTLTGYNSSMSNRSFAEKKSIDGGFEQSSVRLNAYVRKQAAWGEEQIVERGEDLARQAVRIWPHHGADETRLRQARIAALRQRASKRTPDTLTIRPPLQSLLDSSLAQLRSLGDVIEVVEKKSVCCYTPPEFFAEVLPMAGYLRLLLPLSIDEISVAEDLDVSDATQWSWIPNRVHTECDVFIDLYDEGDVQAAMPLVRQALSCVGSDR